MRNYVTTFNPFFDSLFFSTKDSDTKLMRTDIIEHENDYVLRVEVPDIEKKDIKVSLNDGNLSITVTKHDNHEEKGKYLMRERRVGTYSRSYYVGESVKLKDVSAKLDNGVLTLTINKVVESPEEKEQFVEIQ